MIVKGKARSGPAQLAAYLMRPEERATLIDLWDGSGDLRKAFLSWHAVGEATRGEKTLYHAQISPEAAYAMTPDQWRKAAQILAEELGMKDHPRAIVVHEGHGRPHAHVVFQRADADTLKMWDDSFNYVKHERASDRMEREFGHEFVPGKHAKRDREQQPEFPKAAFDQDEAQQAARSGTDPKAQKAEIKSLYAAADGGPAFKTALEDAGYLLAKGDRGYLVVDAEGGHAALTRQLGLKKKELESFMAAVPLASLPDIEQAKARQADMAAQKEAARKEAMRSSMASETAPQPAPTQPAPAPQQPASKFVPELAAVPPAEPAGPAIPKTLDPIVEKALRERQSQDEAKLVNWHAAELKQLRHVLDLALEEKLGHLNALQQAERDRLQRDLQAQRSGIEGFIDAVQRRLNPKLAAEQTEARKQAWEQLRARQAKEREAQILLLRQDKEEEIAALREKHEQQRREQKSRFEQERERYLKEQETAERLRERIEAERREQERQRREGPEPPRRGK